MVNSSQHNDNSRPSIASESHQLLDDDDSLSNKGTKNSESSESIKAVAVYEIVKGAGALTGAFALWLWHANLERWLAQASDSWQQHFGNLLSTQIESIVQIAQQANKNWPLFLLFIFAYVSLRFIEAYGLWQDKTWAYWFSVIGYGIFIPIEIYYLIVSPFDWFKLGILLLNIIIVVVVYRNMKRKGLI
ncbi:MULTISPECIES: DUF2127 domain-containing protein [unclassified Psychrobacter]|uniref:DUF2127 domain-containing protein n=1 Tax=unclassified Psychrobacter TaxID=196806 RepID=UPI00071E7E72|nr:MULTISPECIES: DUF2127 domain-containing protein [unclassified Psychrobacter]OLF35856.1 hypothetical protein BTV98_11885 [Psychrobacter sp. Cmf 22.2]